MLQGKIWNKFTGTGNNFLVLKPTGLAGPIYLSISTFLVFSFFSFFELGNSTMLAKAAWARMLNQVKAHFSESKLMVRDVTPKETKGNKESNVWKKPLGVRNPHVTHNVLLYSVQRREVKAPVDLKGAKTQRKASK